MGRRAPFDLWKKLPKNTDLRLIALQRVLNEKNSSRRALGKAMEIGETTIQGWFNENRFPERYSERLQRVLSLPPTFFADIHAGRSYEDALRGPQEQEDTQSEALRATLLRLTRILTSDAKPGETEDEILARWQKHLNNQIELIDHQTFTPLTPAEERQILDKLEAILKKQS